MINAKIVPIKRIMCENCPYKRIIRDMLEVRNGRKFKRRVDDLINAVYNIITKIKGDIQNESKDL